MQSPWKLPGRTACPAPDVLEGAVLARCPSCRNTFSTELPGRQSCPVCGKPLVVPEAPAAAAEPAEAGAAPAAGTPWERRDELGFWSAWGRTLQQALLEPAELFTSARLDRGAAQLGFAVLTTSVAWTLGQLLEGLVLRGQREQLRRALEALSGNPDLHRLLDSQMQMSSPVWVVGLALLTPIFTLVFLYANAAITHAVAALLGKARRGFAATFAACAYACAPLVFLAVPGCGFIVGILWAVVLTSIGMRIAHRISAGAAAAAVLAPYLVLCCATFLAAGSFAVAFRRATGQP